MLLWDVYKILKPKIKQIKLVNKDNYIPDEDYDNLPMVLTWRWNIKTGEYYLFKILGNYEGRYPV